MYYRSGTERRCCTFVLCLLFVVDLQNRDIVYRLRQTLRVLSPGGSTLLLGMMWWPPSWKCGSKTKIRLLRSMHIHLRNNPAKFHPDPIWNDGALGFFKEVTPRRTVTRTRWVAIWDQLQIMKHISTPRPSGNLLCSSLSGVLTFYLSFTIYCENVLRKFFIPFTEGHFTEMSEMF